MRNNNAVVSWNGSVVATNPGGSNPTGEEPQKAVDNNTATKWLDFNMSTGTSVLLINNTVGITSFK